MHYLLIFLILENYFASNLFAVGDISSREAVTLLDIVKLTKATL